MISFVVVEVAAGSLSGPDHSMAVMGPLADLQAAPSSGGAGGIPALEVAPHHERPAGLVIGAAATCPSTPAAPVPLVALVAGTKDILGQVSAMLEGLGGLAETSCQVRASADFLL